jgi:hypothetical protein
MRRGAHSFLVGKTPRERDHLEELGLDERRVLRHIFKKKGLENMD